MITARKLYVFLSLATMFGHNILFMPILSRLRPSCRHIAEWIGCAWSPTPFKHRLRHNCELSQQHS